MPTAAEHHDALREALGEVAESSFFAWVEPLGPARFGELALEVPEWLQASVLFEGAFGGAVQCVLPEALARDLLSAFLGGDRGAAPDETLLFDLAGEFANMVCGAWLTRTCQRRRFDLHHPEVSRLPADLVAPESEDCLLAMINGSPCYVRLAFTGA